MMVVATMMMMTKETGRPVLCVLVWVLCVMKRDPTSRNETEALELARPLELNDNHHINNHRTKSDA